MVSPGPEVLAVVPARGGSKSLPRKNVRTLAGHPLVAWAIAAGASARSVTRLVVSTDDPEIAEVARRYGAEVPFLRPPELAGDATPDHPVFHHALSWLEEEEGYRPDAVVHLRPTSPLRPPGKVDEAVERLVEDGDADSVRGVTPSSQNPFKMWTTGSDGSLEPLLGAAYGEPYNMPRQQLPATFWQTGHVDVVRRSTILERGSMTGRRILPVFFDGRLAVDIDSAADLSYAEWLLETQPLDVVRPCPRRRAPLPGPPSLVVLDFDGVLTDDRVWTTTEGTEAVVCSRKDGLGLQRLREAGVPVVVISKEADEVVARRCGKLGLAFHQGIEDKPALLRKIVEERGIDLGAVVFVGNDVNDVACMAMVGCGVAVSDAHRAAREAAHIVLEAPGGRGAVRELCDRILAARRGED